MTKRYSFDCEAPCCKVEDEQGEFVRYNDYAVLFAKWIGAEKFASWYKQEKNRLEKENEELRAELDARTDTASDSVE